MRASTLGLILVIALGACTPSAPPRSDEEKIVTEALRHALVDQKDIPGYGNLPEGDTLVVLNHFLLTRGKPTLTARDLPRTDEWAFVLLPLGDLEKYADLHGPKGIAISSWPEVVGASATVALSIVILRREGDAADAPSPGHWLPETLGHYTLEFRRANAVWQFVRVVPEDELIRSHNRRHSR